jgi:hypothetical protein
MVARTPLFLSLLFVAAALPAGCADPRSPADAAPALTDLDGVPQAQLLHPAPGRWSTLLFVGTECPISNHYAPEIRRICTGYAAAGAQCTLVYPGQLKSDEVRAHLAAFRLDLPAVIDRDHVLVAHTGATVTPQAAVFTSDGTLAYRGRIDDLYASLGRPRQRATTQDLRNALDDLAAGRPVRMPRTQAIGCYIE